MSNRSEPHEEKWNRIVAAAKAARSDAQDPGESADQTAPPQEFSRTLFGRLRAFHASLAAWQRWSLIAGLVSILLFVASLIYLNSNKKNNEESPIIETPGIDLPDPSTNPTER